MAIVFAHMIVYANSEGDDEIVDMGDLGPLPIFKKNEIVDIPCSDKCKYTHFKITDINKTLYDYENKRYVDADETFMAIVYATEPLG